MEWTTVILWILVVVLVVIGVAGTALPVLPGALLVFFGLLFGAWIDGFERVGGWTLTLIGVLAGLTYVVDFAASALGAKRVGASRRAVVGAVVGGVVGLFFGIVGVLVGPFAGAVIGEFTVQRNLSQAGRVGVGTWIGMALGMAAKLALVFTMIGTFLIALRA